MRHTENQVLGGGNRFGQLFRYQWYVYKCIISQRVVPLSTVAWSITNIIISLSVICFQMYHSQAAWACQFRLMSSSNCLFCVVEVAKTASGRTFAIEYWAVETQWVNSLRFMICTALYQRYAAKPCNSCLQQFPQSPCLFALNWHQPQRHVHAPYRHQILGGGNTFGQLFRFQWYVYKCILSQRVVPLSIVAWSITNIMISLSVICSQMYHSQAVWACNRFV